MDDDLTLVALLASLGVLAILAVLTYAIMRAVHGRRLAKLRVFAGRHGFVAEWGLWSRPHIAGTVQGRGFFLSVVDAGEMQMFHTVLSLSLANGPNRPVAFVSRVAVGEIAAATGWGPEVSCRDGELATLARCRAHSPEDTERYSSSAVVAALVEIMRGAEYVEIAADLSVGLRGSVDDDLILSAMLALMGAVADGIDDCV